MGWKLENGRPVRESITVGPSAPEITVAEEFEAELFACPYCGREYKTVAGLASHEADKHGADSEEE